VNGRQTGENRCVIPIRPYLRYRLSVDNSPHHVITMFYGGCYDLASVYVSDLVRSNLSGSKILSVVDLIFSCLLALFDQICRHFVDRAGRSNWRDRWCFIEDVAQLDGGSSEADGIPRFPAQGVLNPAGT
jgi:hypothetical protein